MGFPCLILSIPFSHCPSFSCWNPFLPTSTRSTLMASFGGWHTKSWEWAGGDLATSVPIPLKETTSFSLTTLNCLKGGVGPTSPTHNKVLAMSSVLCQSCADNHSFSHECKGKVSFRRHIFGIHLLVLWLSHPLSPFPLMSPESWRGWYDIVVPFCSKPSLFFTRYGFVH